MFCPILFSAASLLSFGPMAAFGPPSGADCAIPDGLEENDTPGQASVLGPGFYPGLHVAPDDVDYISVSIPPAATLRVRTRAEWPLLVSGPSTLPSYGYPCEPTDGAYFQYNATSSTVSQILRIEPAIANACVAYDLLIEVEASSASVAMDCLEPNDVCLTATRISDGGYGGLWLRPGDLDFYRLEIAPFATLTVGVLVEGHPLCQAIQGSLLNGDAVGCGGNSTLVLDSDDFSSYFLTHTNPNPTPLPVVLRLDNVAWLCPGNQTGFRYGLAISGSHPLGTTEFCSPMNSNSTGVPTQLSASWGTGSELGLQLRVHDGPPGQWGYFLVGNGFQEPGLPAGQGRFCLSPLAGDRVGRYHRAGTPLSSLGFFEADGTFRNVSNTSISGHGFDVPAALPYLGSATIQPGQTHHFQFWHRESGGTFQFSNGVSVQF